ncbi:SUPPRESSOR OF QUENCHING 1, chloroplastic-like protein [Drosera capensis]
MALLWAPPHPPLSHTTKLISAIPIFSVAYDRRRVGSQRCVPWRPTAAARCVKVVEGEERNEVSVGNRGERELGKVSAVLFDMDGVLCNSEEASRMAAVDVFREEIDFVDERVRTLAGNGTKGSDYKGGGRGTSQLLNSPWDVCFDPASEKVFIAMAGQHQIWEYNTSDGTTKAFSGDGYERNLADYLGMGVQPLNGQSSASTSFAQPSGISLSSDVKVAYIADSESSSIRMLDLKTGGSRLLADQDVDPSTKQVRTLAGTGKAGFKDGTPLTAQKTKVCNMPSAVLLFFLFLYDLYLVREIPLILVSMLVHTILAAVGACWNCASRQRPPAPKIKTMKRLRKRLSADTKIISVSGGAAKEGILHLMISVPDGYHFSKEARSKYSVETEPENAVVYHCKEDEVCLYQSLAFEVPFEDEKSDATPAEISLQYVVGARSSNQPLPINSSS